MNDKYYMDAHRINRSQETEDINWVEIFKKIWNIRKKIYKAVGIGIIFGLIVGFSIPKQYSVAVVLSPELSAGNSEKGIASLASSFLGSLAQGREDALSALQASEIVSSTPYLLELLELRMTNESQQIGMKLSEYLDSEKGAWWNSIFALPRKAINGVLSLFKQKKQEFSVSNNKQGVVYLSEKQLQKLNLLRSKVQATVDKKIGIITVNVRLQDPIITATLADSVVTKLQKFIVNYKVSKANDDCRYWEAIYQKNKDRYFVAQREYAKFVDSNNNVILQSTIVERERLQNEVSLAYQGYSQVAQQLQIAKAKLQESKPAFTILEPAVVPLYPDTISKFTVILITVMFIVAVCIFWELYVSLFIKHWKDKLL